MGTVAVIVGTYGDEKKWSYFTKRALNSVAEQIREPDEVIHTHDVNLSAARNRGAEEVSSDWLIFLDADDELDYGYVKSMMAIAEAGGPRALYWPSTLGIYDKTEDRTPVLIKPKPSLLIGNHMVIGTMLRRDLFLHVGGFRDLPVLEDWDLWIRCVLDGALPVAVPAAIYRVYVHTDSRNHDVGLHSKTYRQIQQQYQMEWNRKGLK